MEENKKPRVVFPFVEAGLGHIMPMKAIADAFENKYGDKAEVVRTYFYQDTKDPDMKFVEDELIREVKAHNKHKWWGSLHFLLMRLFGTRLSMKVLMEVRYKRGFQKSMDYLAGLDPDLIVNTHFSTLYCSCKAKAQKHIKAQVFAYCPDPVVGLQWDNRADVMGLSSEAGKRRAARGIHFSKNKLAVVPFFIRKEVESMDKGRAYYREQLGLPKDNFTILLADGAYGAGKLKDTVYELLKSGQRMTVVAVCGKNETLYKEFQSVVPPENITFVPYGFTDKVLTLAASCDLFMGKAGASNLAEPAYFGAPSIVTFCATPIEKWICQHHTAMGNAVKVTNIKKAVKLAESFAKNPERMSALQENCAKHHRTDGAELFADIIWQRLKAKEENKSEIVNGNESSDLIDRTQRNYV